MVDLDIINEMLKRLTEKCNCENLEIEYMHFWGPVEGPLKGIINLDASLLKKTYPFSAFPFRLTHFPKDMY